MRKEFRAAVRDMLEDLIRDVLEDLIRDMLVNLIAFAANGVLNHCKCGDCSPDHELWRNAAATICQMKLEIKYRKWYAHKLDLSNPSQCLQGRHMFYIRFFMSLSICDEHKRTNELPERH